MTQKDLPQDASENAPQQLKDEALEQVVGGALLAYNPAPVESVPAKAVSANTWAGNATYKNDKWE